MAGTSGSQADEHRLVDLMVAYQSGDPGAFAQLHAALAEELLRYFARTHRDVARDLVQDLFLEMHRSRRSYSPPLPVRPWVYGVARNVAARSRRAANLAPLPGRDGEQPMPSINAASPADALDIQKALATLPASTREPWLLHHLFGFSFDSIAARLGITVMAAKLRSSRASRALRAALTVTEKSSS